ncbi:flp pilus-assembly TadE/G-like family protein [Flindersiella endophytica]
MKDSERGSGTIWTIAIACILVIATCLIANLTLVMSAERRAGVAADLAALSAVASDCGRAATIATAHRARLVSCRTLDQPGYGTTVEVTAEVRTKPIFGHVFVLKSRARAGRSSPPAVEYDLPL